VQAPIGEVSRLVEEVIMSTPRSTDHKEIYPGSDDSMSLNEQDVNVGAASPIIYKPLFVSILKGIMNLMVDGLSPWVKNDRRSYDLIVVGGGLNGLTAALHAAREGIDTLVIERSGTGSQVGVIECIDHCGGVPPNVEDGRLGDQRSAQEKHFQLGTLTGRAVTAIWVQGDGKIVTTETGDEYYARALLLATGTRHRRLNVPGEEDFIGAGIHFCATCEGLFYQGKNVVVVGGGHRGVQEALLLARSANKVTLLVKSNRLNASQVHQEKVAIHPKVEVRLHTTVQEFMGDGELSTVVVKDMNTGKTEELKTGAVFFVAGRKPNTDFLRGVVELDQWGFIRTSQTLETNIEGVFAAGDTRASSSKQVAGAVGEGATAALMIRQYLEKSEGSRGYRGD